MGAELGASSRFDFETGIESARAISDTAARRIVEPQICCTRSAFGRVAKEYDTRAVFTNHFVKEISVLEKIRAVISVPLEDRNFKNEHIQGSHLGSRSLGQHVLVV